MVHILSLEMKSGAAMTPGRNSVAVSRPCSNAQSSAPSRFLIPRKVTVALRGTLSCPPAGTGTCSPGPGPTSSPSQFVQVVTRALLTQQLRVQLQNSTHRVFSYQDSRLNYHALHEVWREGVFVQWALPPHTTSPPQLQRYASALPNLSSRPRRMARTAVACPGRHGLGAKTGERRAVEVGQEEAVAVLVDGAVLENIHALARVHARSQHGGGAVVHLGAAVAVHLGGARGQQQQQHTHTHTETNSCRHTPAQRGEYTDRHSPAYGCRHGAHVKQTVHCDRA